MISPRCSEDPRCIHDIPPNVLMVSLRCLNTPDVLNIPRCTEHTLYRVMTPAAVPWGVTSVLWWYHHSTVLNNLHSTVLMFSFDVLNNLDLKLSLHTIDAILHSTDVITSMYSRTSAVLNSLHITELTLYRVFLINNFAGKTFKFKDFYCLMV